MVEQEKPTEGTPTGDLSIRAKIKLPLACLGNWKHPSYGEVSFEQTDFDQMIANLENNKLGFKPFLTFGHLAEEPESTDAHRKRGDLEKLSQEGGVLYGFFDVPEYVRDAVQNREYEYTSGEFIRNLTDKQSGIKLGCAISRVALTNSPFLTFDGVKAQALSQGMEGETGGFIMQMNNTSSSPSDAPAKEEVVAKTYTTAVYKEKPMSVSETLPNQAMDSPKNEVEAPLPSSVQPSVQPPTQTMEVQQPNQQSTSDSIPQGSVQRTSAPQSPTTTPVVQQTTGQQPEAQQPAPVVPQINIEAIIAQVRAGVMAEFQKESLERQTLINNLQAEVTRLNGELNKQKETTHAFSQTVAAAQVEAQQRQLLSQGMPPAVIPKYLALYNALVTNPTTYKLSLGSDGETKDVTTVSALQELVTECLSMGAVPLGQMGASNTSPTPGGLLGDLKTIVERNKQMANKVDVRG